MKASRYNSVIRPRRDGPHCIAGPCPSCYRKCVALYRDRAGLCPVCWRLYNDDEPSSHDLALLADFLRQMAAGRDAKAPNRLWKVKLPEEQQHDAPKQRKGPRARTRV
jgi:hypothetical protein